MSAYITVDEVRARIAEIAAARDDEEAAHGLEDELWRTVLLAIADGAPDHERLAEEALKSRHIAFPRWCA